jgi:hypothetical protein
MRGMVTIPKADLCEVQSNMSHSHSERTQFESWPVNMCLYSPSSVCFISARIPSLNDSVIVTVSRVTATVETASLNNEQSAVATHLQ